MAMEGVGMPVYGNLDLDQVFASVFTDTIPVLFHIDPKMRELGTNTLLELRQMLINAYADIETRKPAQIGTPYELDDRFALRPGGDVWVVVSCHTPVPIDTDVVLGRCAIRVVTMELIIHDF